MDERVKPERRASPGDEIVLPATDEHAQVLAVIDATGTLLVQTGGVEFQVGPDEWVWPWARHAGCGCCG